MTRQTLWALAVALSACAFGFADDEPTYQGRSMSSWVKQLKDKDRKTVDVAVKALAAIGEPAEKHLYEAFAAYQLPAVQSIGTHWYISGKKGIPWLTKALRDKNPHAAAHAAATLVFLHEKHNCLPKDSDIRADAEKALKAAEKFEDERERQNAKGALDKLATSP